VKQEKTSVHILRECEATASLTHTHLGSFFLNPEDIMNLSIGAIWKFAEGTGLFNLLLDHGAQKDCFKA